MSVTSQLGPSGNQLGSILLGQLDGGGRFISRAHFLDSRTVRFIFPLPVTEETALLASSYLVEMVSAPGSYYLPTIHSVSFYDAERVSVVVEFDRSFTTGVTYGFTVAGVESDGGILSNEDRIDSVATVTDPPQAIGAYLAGLQRIDVVFDRPVGPTTSSHSGSITDGTNTSSLSGSSWASPMADNVLRFTFSACPTANALFVDYANVVDGSKNPGQGRIALYLPLRSALPYSYAKLNTAQITDAYVDYSVPALGYSYLNVHFAHAMLPGIESLGFWQVTRVGSHVGDDSANNVGAPPATDISSLVILAGALQGVFNAHLGRDGIHVGGPVKVLSEGAVIAAVNDLSRMLDIHVLDNQAHISSDSSSASFLTPAHTLEQAGVNLGVLIQKFNQHRSSTVHTVPDSDYDFLGSYVGTHGLESIAAWADDLRWKLRLHALTSSYHPAIHPVVPQVPPCSPRVEVQSPTFDLIQSILVVNEMGEKYAAHVSSDKVHPFFDDVNVVSVFTPTVDVNACIARANVLLAAFDGHTQTDYSAGLQSVTSFVSDPGFIPDGMGHFARLRISSISPAPITIKIAYGAQFSFVGNPGSNSVSTSDFSGVIVARTARDVSRITSVATDRKTHSVAFDKQTQSSSYRASLDGSPVPVSVVYSSSIRSLSIFAASLADKHTAHLATPPTGSTHSVQDLLNGIPGNQYPSYTLASVASTLNYIRQAFNTHVSDKSYHLASISDRAVLVPSATDLDSCMVLARALDKAIESHVDDGSVHSAPGVRVDLSKLTDTIVFRFRGLKDGGAYSVQSDGSCLIQLRDGVRSEVHFGFPSSFVGRESPPHLASVVAEPGLKVRFPSGFPILGPDTVRFFFSRPMSLEPVVASTQISVTGPAGIEMKNPTWESPQSMKSEVLHISTGSYSVGVSGMTDAFGNTVAP